MIEYLIHPIIKKMVTMIGDEIRDQTNSRVELLLGLTIPLFIIVFILLITWRTLMKNTYNSVLTLYHII